MAERLPRYRPLGVGVASVPAVDYTTAARMQASSYESMSAALNKMSQFAFGVAEKQAIKAGQEFGAANPREALKSAREEFFPTAYGSAAAKTANSVLKSQVETEARKAMSLAALEAKQGRLTPEQAAEKFSAVSDGFGATLDLVDPAIAQELQQELGLLANTYYIDHTENFVKQQKAIAKANGLEGATEHARQIEDQARVMGRLPAQQFDSALELGVSKFREYLTNQNFSPEEVAKQVISLKERAHMARVRGSFAQQETREDRRKWYSNFLRDAEAGGELVRGLDDKIVKSISAEIKSSIDADEVVLKKAFGELSAYAQKNIFELVNKGRLPEPGLIAEARERALEISKTGVDTSQFVARLDSAQRASAFFKSLNGKSLSELRLMRDGLVASFADGANQDELLGLTGLNARINDLTKANETLAQLFQPTVKDTKKALEDATESVKKWRKVPDSALKSIRTAISTLKGRPEAEELALNLQQVEGRLAVLNKVVGMNPRNLEAAINAYRVQAERDGVDPFENETLVWLEQRLKDQRNGLKTDPVAWAIEAGEILPDSIFALTAPGLTPEERKLGYEKRVAGAVKFAAQNNIQPVMITDVEAQNYANAMKELSAKGKLSMMADLQDGFGVYAQGVFDAISPHAREIMHIASSLNNGMPSNVAMEALIGLDKIKNKVAPEFQYQNETIKEVLRTEVPKLPGSAQFQRGLIDTANALFATRAESINGDVDSIKSAYTDALQDAAGRVAKAGGFYGGIVEVNDQKVIVPESIPQSGDFTLQDAIESAPRSAFVMAAGSIPMGRGGIPMSMDTIKSKGYFVNIPGKDAAILQVMINDVPAQVLNENGDPYVINLRQFYNFAVDAKENPLPEMDKSEEEYFGPGFLERARGRMQYPYKPSPGLPRIGPK